MCLCVVQTLYREQAVLFTRNGKHAIKQTSHLNMFISTIKSVSLFTNTTLLLALKMYTNFD